MKNLRMIALLVAAGALLAVPTVGQAHKTDTKHNHGKANGKGKAKSKCVVNKGYVVKGTLTDYTAGDNGSVTITVTGANKHARVSGELDDQNATQDGVQVAGDSYTVDHVNPTDAFSVKLSGYEGTDTPSDGDAVRIVGKVEVERKKCAEAGDTTADRYGAVNVRQVKIADRDPDA